MPSPHESAARASQPGRHVGRILTVLLLAGAALTACERGQPVGPDRAAPDRPSLALNPACDAGLGGVTHTDSVLAAETWSRADNPHRVNQLIHVHGAGVLTLQPGVLVCFGTGAGLAALGGGRLVANGLDTARIVLTAADPDSGWWGVHMAGSPTTGSSLRNVRLEHTRTVYSLSTNDYHAAAIDSVVFRQVEHGLHLWGRGTSIRRSRLDTVTSAAVPAVALGNVVTFEQNTIRGAAGVGLAVLGTSDVSLLGGRIEGSGGVGLQANAIAGPGFTATQPVRVVGGAGYPAELSVGAFSKIYTQISHQDSLLGNARDTLVVTGGALTWLGIASNKIPWRVTGDITVTGWGGLNALPGARLTFDSAVSITATNGGRVVAHGTAAAPAVFTSTASAGWGGIVLEGAPTLGSALTNVRIENAKNSYGVMALHEHTVVIDSAVFRQNGSAIFLKAANSRLSRSRIDTTLIWRAAVIVEANGGVVESTLIRGSRGEGLRVGVYWNIQVRSCEIRDNRYDGIELWVPIEVHNCNLVNNGRWGIANPTAYLPNVEDNWWGDAAGPTGPNGDGVSGYDGYGYFPVDYTPWRTTPYVLPYVP
jgi:phage gp46-like protein